jgi:enoyl-[acyl-carrier protein] reductase I
MGLANDRSLAWGIAKALHAQGAEMAFSYQGEALEKRVRPLAAEVGSDFLIDCDVSDMAAIDRAFAKVAARWPKIDFLVHAIGAVTRAARPLMIDGGSVLTLTYYGAEKVVPHYNVMGVAKAALESSVKYLAMDLGPENIRVNAISAGPIKTLAASGIGDFRYILKWNELNSPLRRNVTIEDVGGAGLYMLSDLASGVTGEIHHVDAGYNVIGMKAEDAPDIALA